MICSEKGCRYITRLLMTRGRDELSPPLDLYGQRSIMSTLRLNSAYFVLILHLIKTGGCGTHYRMPTSRIFFS